MPRFALEVWHESYKCVKYLHQDRKNTLLFWQAETCYSDYSLLEADANMPGPQTHTKVSTWHFWHICKGPTDNQLMWESKSHAKELFKNLRSAQVQQQKPRAGSMRADMEKSPRKPPATSQLCLHSTRCEDFKWGQHSPHCWAAF